MKTYILLIFLCFISNSCDTKNSKSDISNNDVKMKITFNFCPSSGGNPRYSIVLNDSSLTIVNNEMIDVHKSKYERILTLAEIYKVQSFINQIEPDNNAETDIILDSWRIELIINGIVYYNKTDVRIDNLPNNIKELFDFLVKQSTIQIDLYGFS